MAEPTQPLQAIPKPKSKLVLVIIIIAVIIVLGGAAFFILGAMRERFERENDLGNMHGGNGPEQQNNTEETSNNENPDSPRDEMEEYPPYPETTEAPTLHLAWDGQVDLSNITRTTPYGVWEDWFEYEDGIAYEPAVEMQFYLITDATDFLAVAPGVLIRIEVDEAKNLQKNSPGVGSVMVRYGRAFTVKYDHIVPDPNLILGSHIAVGDKLGTMEKKIHEVYGEETWWEIEVIRDDREIHKAVQVPPYPLFDDESKATLDQIVEAAGEWSPYWETENGGRSWVITGGCAWVKYFDKPEWINQVSDTAIEGWHLGDDQGRVIGPTDVCR